MQGKRGLIMGVANDHSIAWGIAKAVAAQGAELAFTYQGEALGKRVKPLAESLGSSLVEPCDVEDLASVDAMFAPVVNRLHIYEIPVSPATRAYMNAIMALPAWAAWHKDAAREKWRVEKFDAI